MKKKIIKYVITIIILGCIGLFFYSYIGIDKEILQLPKIELIKGNYVIDDELSLFTNVQQKYPLPKGNKWLHEKQGEEYVQDTFTHEQNLVIKYDEEKYALISDCAHNGI